MADADLKWRRLLVGAATLLALFAVCAIAVWLGLRIHHTILLFALGGLVAYALDPLVSRVQKRLTRTQSVLAVYAVLTLIFVAGVAYLGEHVAKEAALLQQHAPLYQDRALEMARNLDDGFFKPRGFAFSAEDTIKNPPPEFKAYVSKFGVQALPFVAHTLTDLGEAGLVFLIALYFLIFGTELKNRLNAALSPGLRSYAVTWEEDVNRILGGFVRGQFMLAILNGVFAAIGLLAFGVHLWLVLALFAVVASLIPVFGPYIAALPAVVAALVTPTHFTPVAGAIVVFILFAVINEVGSKILYPKLVGEALNLHEVLVLFVLFAGLEIDGIVGALFAAPVASLAMITLVHLYRLWQQSPEQQISDQILRESQAPSPWGEGGG